MAHLNLRDRVIETTIAYVGAEGHDGATNIAHVRRDAHHGRAGALEETRLGNGRLLSLAWRPRDGAKLNDCDVAVTLVSTEGPVDANEIERVLVDADGLVLVLEAAPEAEERNRRAITIVERVLASAPDKATPVVVQVNRREDVADGMGDAQQDLGARVGEWPHVRACTSKGDGIMETLKRAVDGVVESMQRPITPAATDVSALRSPAQAAGTARAEGNPLLAALRQILQATVSDHVASMEARIVDRVALLTASRDDEARAANERVAAFDQRMARVEAAIAELADGAKRERSALRQTVDHAVKEHVSSIDRHLDRMEAMLAGAATTTAGREQVAAVQSDVERVETRFVADALAHHESVMGEMREYRKAMRDEVSRSLMASVSPLQKTMDALAAEIKKATAREVAADVNAALDRVGANGEEIRAQVEALVVQSRGFVTRLEALAPTIKQFDGDAQRRFADLRDAVRALRDEVEVRSDATQAEVAALIEELQKKKKTWFG